MELFPCLPEVDMTDNSESRLDRLESLMTQSGEIILRTTELAQQNSEQIGRLGTLVQQNSEQTNRLEQLVQRSWEQGTYFSKRWPS